MKKNDTQISIDQMYSKDVFSRRNKALKHRRSLIEDGETRKMFVKYPAKLMVKQNDKYEILKDF